MSKQYYFEPTSSPLNEDQVRLQLGSQVLDWDWTRQRDVGLYLMVVIDAEYNPFLEAIDAPVYTKIDNTDPEFVAGYNRDEYYIREWSYTPLTGADAAAATTAAETIALQQALVFLAETHQYLDQAAEEGVAVHADLITYRAELKDIENDANYPEVLAYEHITGVYTNWPVKPTNFIDATTPG